VQKLYAKAGCLTLLINLDESTEKPVTSSDTEESEEDLSGNKIYEEVYMNSEQTREKSDLKIPTVEVPLEALVKELGANRTVEFIVEIRARYGDSIVEQKKATESLTIKQIEAEVEALTNQRET
jgi:hypothetical protein